MSDCEIEKCRICDRVISQVGDNGTPTVRFVSAAKCGHCCAEFWAELEQVHRTGRIVVIESPYRAYSELELQRNLAYCRALVRFVVNRGDSPLASHLDITQALDDRDPEQRERGIAAGLARLRVADVHLFGVDLGWSSGMKRALEASPSHCTVEKVPLPDWADAMKSYEAGGDRGPLDALIAANQPMWHAHEVLK